jgi:hypothetical protein
MRIRFSLRTFFVLVTLLAGICYVWFVMPTVTAKHFIQAVSDKNYTAADRFFDNTADRFIANTAEQYWGFDSTAELMPVSLGQLLSGRRLVRLDFRYFHLDENVSSNAQIVATPFALRSPRISSSRAAVILGPREGSIQPEVQRVR